MDKELSDKVFNNIKKQILSCPDASKKGSYDTAIIHLIDFINNENDYVTTSSCSGRITLLSGNSGGKKNDCAIWYQTHELAIENDLIDVIKKVEGPIYFKFEAFCLHVQCRTLSAAKQLLDIARDAGYKDSGIVIGKHGKIILAVRNKCNLEVPISNGEELLVSETYLKYIIHLANEKMIKNSTQIKKFECGIMAHFNLKGIECLGLNEEMPSNNKPKVFITRSDFPESGIKLLKESCEVEIFLSEDRDVTSEELLEKLIGKEALYVHSKNKIDKDVILSAAQNGVKVIATFSVGLDHIDLEAAKANSIRIGYTPDVLTEATAELTVAILLATSRRVLEGYNKIVRGEWKEWSPTFLVGKGLNNATVGFFGFGRIGQSVAKKLLSFGVSKVLYTGPRRKNEDESFGAEYVDFDILLKESDFVLVTCPLNDETKGAFTAEKFSIMKPSAIFVNTARGGIVDQDALIDALQNKTIAAAGLDVMTPEPIPPDHPLLKLDNCVLTPHIGSATTETREQMSILTAKNILGALNGEKMPAEYSF